MRSPSAGVTCVARPEEMISDPRIIMLQGAITDDTCGLLPLLRPESSMIHRR
jgi:hypothetical protein